LRFLKKTSRPTPTAAIDTPKATATSAVGKKLRRRLFGLVYTYRTLEEEGRKTEHIEIG